MTLFEYMRKRLLERKGIFDALEPIPDFATLQKTQWSTRFETLMRNRLLMGAFRYGPFRRTPKKQYDCVGSAIERLKLYQQSGNQEHLVDAANLCLVEFVVGRHPNKHFDSSDDGVHVKEA